MDRTVWQENVRFLGSDRQAPAARIAMMLLGFAGLGFVGYRKAKRAALSAA